MRDKKMELEKYREFLKDNIRRSFDFSETDQNRGLPPPPVEKPCPEGSRKIKLPPPKDLKSLSNISLFRAIGSRKSTRDYSGEALTLGELSFLLWASQGVRGKPAGGHAFRTVPSAGCRHALETYLAVFRVAGLEKGVYRYLPLSHCIVCVSLRENLEHAASEAALGQAFMGSGAVAFIWTAVPYRMEWRYGPVSHKVIALDAGHACQNLYLASCAVGAGTCAVAAYDQEKADELAGVDGREEFVVYMASAGKN